MLQWRQLLEASGSLESSADRRLAWWARGILLAVLALAFWSTWATWATLIVDCGREMYVPAELTQGKRLYHDVFYNYMPLPPYVHALLFRLFGIHLNVLYWTGFAVTAASALLLHAIALRFLPPVAALAVSLSYAARLFAPSIFNNILPYSYGASYGHLGCLASLYFLLLHRETERFLHYSLAAVGACVALLSKHEYGMAAYGALIVVAVSDAWLEHNWRSLARRLGAMIPGLALAGAWTAWCIWPDSYQHFVETNWIAFPGGYFMKVYGPTWIAKQGLTLNAGEIALLAVIACVPIAFWTGIAWLSRKVRGWKSGLALAAGLVLLAILAVLARRAPGDIFLLTRVPLIPSNPFYQCLMMAVGGVLGLLLPGRFRPPTWVVAFLPVAFFGCLLSVRVMNDWKLISYSVFYAPIATLAFAVLAARAVMHVLRDMGEAARGAVLALVFGLQAISAAWFVHTEVPLQLRPDHLLKTARGEMYVQAAYAGLAHGALEKLAEVRRRRGTVVILPEATALYFLSGVSSPSRYYFFHPGVLAPGQVTREFLAELERKPPDLILLTNRSTAEYQRPYFGLDYDLEVMQWVQVRYRPAFEIGRFIRAPNAAPAAIGWVRKEDPQSDPGAAGAPQSGPVVLAGSQVAARESPGRPASPGQHNGGRDDVDLLGRLLDSSRPERERDGGVRPPP